jgi:hypothetical protein
MWGEKEGRALPGTTLRLVGPDKQSPIQPPVRILERNNSKVTFQHNSSVEPHEKTGHNKK